MIKFRFVLLLIFLVIVTTLCQRGGGSRSSSRSSSRSRSSYGRSSYGRRRSRGSSFTWSGWPFFSSETDNSTNSTTTSEQEQQSDEKSSSGYGWIGAFLAAFAGFGYLGHKQDQKKKIQRKQRIQRLFNDFEAESQQQMCTLSDQQMINSRDWFMENRWKIIFKTRDNSFRDKAQVTLKNIQERTRFSYNFEMSMTDGIGWSTSQGILVHQRDYLAIMFEKTYNNRTQAGQTGNFDLLMYQGVQQGQAFRGRWYYKGYETSQQYSGTWQMLHQ